MSSVIRVALGGILNMGLLAWSTHNNPSNNPWAISVIFAGLFVVIWVIPAASRTQNERSSKT